MHHIPCHSRGPTSPSSDPVAEPSWRQGEAVTSQEVKGRFKRSHLSQEAKKAKPLGSSFAF